MAIYYVDGVSGNDSTGTGATGAPWKTLAKANQTAAAGDTVRVRTATYYERLIIAKNNLTFENDTGHTPTINGRYDPTLFGKAGYKNSKGEQVKANELPAMRADNAALGNWFVWGNYANLVGLTGTGAKIRGFVIRNVPGRAIGMGGDNTLVENCRIDFTYSGGINIETAKNCRVNNVVATRVSVNFFNPTISTEPGIVGQGVVTAFIIKGEDNIVENCLVAYCYGEGIAASKKGKRQIIRYNTSHTCNHWMMGTNASDGAQFYGNTVYYCVNLYDHFKNKTSGNITDSFVAGDEVAGKENFKSEPSIRTKIYNNLFIGGNRAFLSGGKDRPFTWTQAYFGYNTVIGSKYTNAPMVQFIFNTDQDPHANSVWENNIFLKHPQQSGAMAQYGGGNGIVFRNNLSNGALASGMGGTQSIVTGAAGHGLANPFVDITGVYDYKSTSLPDPTDTTFDPANYDLTAGAPGRGKASNRSNINGLTLPVINKDRYGYARSDMNAGAGLYYDIGSDEYGSNAPPVDEDTITASFNRTPGNGTYPLTVTFTDTSTETGTADIDGWSWTFGDGVGTSSSQNPTYTYTTAGTFSPVLTVTDVSLGLTSTYTGPSITVTPPVTGSVTARYTRSPAAGQAGVTLISFTDTSTTTGNGVINSWAWDFRDGSTSTSQNPTHTYTVAGTYKPRLTVQDTVRGYSHTWTGPDTVITAAPPSDAIEAAFTQSATSGQAPLSVTFTDTSLEAGAANINAWSWDFGDGTTSTTASPTKVYNAAGVYTPVLTIQDTVLGLVDTFTGQPITVTPEEPPPAGGDVVIRQVRAALNTSDGNQTFTQAGLGGIIPKSARFIVTKGVTDGTAADGELFCYGATAGGSQWAACVASDHGVANTNTARLWVDNACMVLIDGSGAEIMRATFVEFTTNGVTVNIDWAAGGTAYLCQVIFGAGTEYEAWAGTAALGGVGSSATVNAGFAPDVAHGVATWGTNGLAATHFYLSLGMAHRTDGQWMLERQYNDGLVDGANDGRLFEGSFLHCRDNPSRRATVTATGWSATGLSLAVTTDTVNSTALLLLEKYGDVASSLAFVNTATTTGNTDYALAFDPQFAQHLISPREGTGTSADAIKAGTIGIHAVTADGEFSAQVSGENGAATTNEQSLSDNQFIIVNHTGTTLAAGATTLGTLKYTINYATAPATALKMIALAVEEGQSTGGGGDYVTAEFTTDVTDGLAPLRVTFTDLSVGTNAITGWLWDFGDGMSSILQNPVHTYQNGGAFDVALTVTDGTIEDTETKTGLINVIERTPRRVIVGPFLMKPITEGTAAVTHKDPAEDEAGYMEAGLSLNALALNADPEVPAARPSDYVVYVDATTGNIMVLYPDGTTGTVTVT